MVVLALLGASADLLDPSAEDLAKGYQLLVPQPFVQLPETPRVFLELPLVAISGHANSGRRLAARSALPL